MPAEADAAATLADDWPDRMMVIFNSEGMHFLDNDVGKYFNIIAKFKKEREREREG